MTSEQRRLEEAQRPRTPWMKWRPYRADVAGIADDQQRLCLVVALRDGYGDDLKAYDSYLESTPTSSYMRYLSRYRHGGGWFLDVLVEYAKAAPEDVLVRVTVGNRGARPMSLHVLPRLWLRDGTQPWLCGVHGPDGAAAIEASHPAFGERYLYYDGEPEVVYTRSEEEGARAVADYRMRIDGGGAGEIRLRLTIAPPETRNDGTLGDDFERMMTMRQQEAAEFATPRAAVATARHARTALAS